MQTVNVRQLKNNPSEALREAKADLVMVMNRDQPTAILVSLELLAGIVDLPRVRYAIALSVHVAAHHAAAIGRAWGVVQTWQSAMILVAPLIGAVVLERWGPAALFAFAAASAVLSFALFQALRILGMPRLQAATPAAPG